MISKIFIKNYILIDELELDLDKGLNIITGETGAGKSILLDSLSFVFGGRADKSLIRSGSNFMRVEAIFNGLSDKQISIIKEASKKNNRILGIHLEGIFINPEKKGIHNPEHFMGLTIDNYKLIEDDFIKIVTLAPEFDKGLIEYY